jgi:hypothetical protein
MDGGGLKKAVYSAYQQCARDLFVGVALMP